MKSYHAWRDTGHLEKAIECAGGPEAFERGQQRLMDEARTWRPHALDLPEMDDTVLEAPSGGPRNHA